MRLTEKEQILIKQVFLKVFERGEIYLFGSRVDDSLKGGDIDLFVEIEKKQNMLKKKIQFLAMLKEKIGDQKIDLILSKDKTRVIEQEAIKKGIKL